MYMKENLSLRSLCNLSGGLTLLRLPLALIFPFVGGDARWAIIVIVLAAISDVLDGYVARVRNTVSHIGGFADGWIDKIFNINVAWSLVVFDWLPWWAGLLLFTREWVQIPMVPYYVTRYVRGKVPPNKPIWTGKACSVFLVAALVASLLQQNTVLYVSVFLTAFFGAAAAYTYLKRELEEYQKVN